MFQVTVDPYHPVARKSISLRKNASEKSINAAIEQLKTLWEEDSKTSIPGTYYLEIGGVVRWGYSAGFDAWGFDERQVKKEIAGQKEYAYRN